MDFQVQDEGLITWGEIPNEHTPHAAEEGEENVRAIFH